MEAQLSARGGAQRGRGGGTGFSPVALQGAGVSFWTNIPHLARTSVQRLRSPASRKGPHHWVQDSELILILAGGCFSPRGSYGFAEASGVNVSSTLVTVITGDYVFSTTNTRFFPPHLRKAGEECRDIAFGFSAGKLRHWTPCVPCMEREVHCQAHSETKRFPGLGREEVGPYSDGHSPIRRALAGSEEGRRKAQGRGPRAQLERPPFFSPHQLSRGLWVSVVSGRAASDR